MAKGHKTGGRQKGSINKVTRDVREAIACAFAEVGGVEYLKGVAINNPQVFCTLLGKTIPTTIAGDADNPLTLVGKLTWQPPSAKS